jgi:hypothetical protein
LPSFAVATVALRLQEGAHDVERVRIVVDHQDSSIGHCVSRSPRAGPPAAAARVPASPAERAGERQQHDGGQPASLAAGPPRAEDRDDGAMLVTRTISARPALMASSAASAAGW